MWGARLHAVWDIEGRRRQLWVSSPWRQAVSRLNYSTAYDTRTKTDANNIYHLFPRGEVSNHSQLFSGRLLYAVDRRLYNWRKTGVV